MIQGIIFLKNDSGVPVAGLCLEHGISNATYYSWRSKYGGMNASLRAQMKAMTDETTQKLIFSTLTTEFGHAQRQESTARKADLGAALAKWCGVRMAGQMPPVGKRVGELHRKLNRMGQHRQHQHHDTPVRNLLFRLVSF